MRFLVLLFHGALQSVPVVRQNSFRYASYHGNSEYDPE